MGDGIDNLSPEGRRLDPRGSSRRSGPAGAHFLIPANSSSMSVVRDLGRSIG